MDQRALALALEHRPVLRVRDAHEPYVALIGVRAARDARLAVRAAAVVVEPESLDQRHALDTATGELPCRGEPVDAAAHDQRAERGRRAHAAQASGRGCAGSGASPRETTTAAA